MLNKLTETLSWTGDGLLRAHTKARADFTDAQSYFYADYSRRLIEERLNVNGTTRWTNTVAFDGGTASGPGVLTRFGQSSAQANLWTGGVDAFARIGIETNTMLHYIARGRLNGPASVQVLLDGQPVPTAVTVTYGGGGWRDWRSVLELSPGVHQLEARAAHPSGWFTATTNSWFTNSVAHQKTTDSFDGGGYLTQRVWRHPDGTTNRIQNFYWDGRGRLVRVDDLDAHADGYLYTMTYDCLGRKQVGFCIPLTNGVAHIQLANYDVHTYDPAVEFLDVAVNLGGKVSWKLYGPDLNGVYGGMNGVGGLEAVISELGLVRPVVGDARGNVLGAVTNGVVAWNASRPTAYGAVPGYRPLPLINDNDVVAAVAWRGRAADVTGFVWLGARLYNPETGSFLSPDPVWSGRDPNYYTFAGGDPINYFDADGRLAKQTFNYAYNGGLGGEALRGISSGLDYLSSQTDNSWLGGYAAYGSSLYGSLAGMSAPSSIVNGLVGFGNNVGTIYDDGGFMPAASYAISGWNVGKVYSGFANLDLVTGEPVGDFYQRGAVFSSGVASTAGIAAGGLGLYNWATTAPANVPPAISTTGEVLGPEGPGQFIFRPGLGSQETATVVRQGEFVNRMFDSSYPAPGVSQPWGSSFSPGSGVPTTADVGIAERGLSLYNLNNAQRAIIFQATENFPAVSRISLGGTAPEILINRANWGSLRPITDFPVTPIDTRPWP